MKNKFLNTKKMLATFNSLQSLLEIEGIGIAKPLTATRI